MKTFRIKGPTHKQIISRAQLELIRLSGSYLAVRAYFCDEYRLMDIEFDALHHAAQLGLYESQPDTNKIIVFYSVTNNELSVTDAEFELVHYQYNCTNPNKVQAIKFLKAQYMLSLREAKDLANAIGASPAY